MVNYNQKSKTFHFQKRSKTSVLHDKNEESERKNVENFFLLVTKSFFEES